MAYNDGDTSGWNQDKFYVEAGQTLVAKPNLQYNSTDVIFNPNKTGTFSFDWAIYDTRTDEEKGEAPVAPMPQVGDIPAVPDGFDSKFEVKNILLCKPEWWGGFGGTIVANDLYQALLTPEAVLEVYTTTENDCSILLGTHINDQWPNYGLSSPETVKLTNGIYELRFSNEKIQEMLQNIKNDIDNGSELSDSVSCQLGSGGYIVGLRVLVPNSEYQEPTEEWVIDDSVTIANPNAVWGAVYDPETGTLTHDGLILWEKLQIPAGKYDKVRITYKSFELSGGGGRVGGTYSDTSSFEAYIDSNNLVYTFALDTTKSLEKFETQFYNNTAEMKVIIDKIEFRKIPDYVEEEPEEPIVRPELDEYVPVAECVSPRVVRTEISNDTPIAGALSGLDESVKNALKAQHEGSYVKVVVENGKIAKLKFNNYGEFMHGFYGAETELKVEVTSGNMYIGSSDNGVTTYYVSYDEIKNELDSAFDSGDNKYDKFVQLSAYGTGTVTWVGVVEPNVTDPTTCPNEQQHISDGWTSVDLDKITYNEDKSVNVPFSNGDRAYVGDTVDYCFIATDETATQIRFYLADGIGYSNDLTPSYIFDLAKGVFAASGTTGVLTQKGDHTSANYFIFKKGNGSSDDITNLTFTHFYYKINCGSHDYSTVYDAKYHWRACKKCGAIEGEKTAHDFADDPLKCSGCNYTHIENEVEIPLSSATNLVSGVTVNDEGYVEIETETVNQVDFALDRAVAFGETIKVHLLASASSAFRFWVVDANGKRPTQPVTASAEGTLYDMTVDIPLNYSGESAGEAVKFLVKGIDSSTKLPDMTIYHIGIVYPGCSHPEEKQVSQFDLTNHWRFCTECNTIIEETVSPHTMSGEKCSGCEFEHYSNEKTITLDDTTINDGKGMVTFENGVVKVSGNTIEVLSFKLGRKLLKGETISVHAVGNIINGNVNGSNGYLRAWLGGVSNYSDPITDINKFGDTFYKGYFQLRRDIVATAETDTFAFKANSSGAKLPEMTLDHLAVVIPECPHNESSDQHAAWVEGKYSEYRAEGNQHRLYCKLCNEPIEEAKDHQAAEGTEYTDTKDGSHTYKCSVCGLTATEAHIAGTEYGSDNENHWNLCTKCSGVVNSVPHDALGFVSDGEDTHHQECKTCGYKSESASHNWDNGVIDPPAGHETSGIKTFTCTDCKQTKTETVEALGHTYGAWSIVNAPTLTAPGTVKRTCTENDGGEETKEVPALSDANEWTVVHTKPATCTSEGLDTYTSKTYGVTVEITVGKTDHSFTTKYEHDDNQHWLVCDYCGIASEEKSAHTPSEYTNNGSESHTYKCSVCEASVTESHNLTRKYDANGHWDYCETCKYESTHEAHTGYTYVDENSHSVDCPDCDYAAVSEEHTPGEDYYENDDKARYHHCTKCGGKCDPVVHEYIWVSDNDETHHQECRTCKHEKTDSTAKHTYVNGICTACSHEHTNHTWGTWSPDESGNAHVRNCTICGKTDSASHDFTGGTNGNGYVSDGTETHHRECATCGYKSDASAHVSDGGKVTTQPTESNPGVRTYTCTQCGEAYKTEEIPASAHVHDGEDTWISDETGHWHVCSKDNCTEADHRYGFGEHVYVNGKCSVCGYQHVNHIPGENATYTDNGNGTHTYICSICGAEVSEAHTEGVQEHDNNHHWTSCIKCDAHIDEAEHVLAYKKDSDGEGGTHHQECSCGYKTESSAHTWDSGEVTKDPTFTEEGVKTYTCTLCQATKTESVPKLTHEHTAGSEWHSDAKTHWHECTDPNCPDSTAKLDEAAHTEDAGTVTKPATELEEGVMTYKCSVCGYVMRTEPIEKLQHTHIPGAEWKHDADGHWHECTSETCDDKTAKLDFASHTWDEGKITTPATETEEGVKTFTCTVCGETKTETVPVLPHVHTPGNEWKHDAEGHWHECTSETCDDKTVKLDFASHTWDEGKITTPATETEEGVKTFTCTVCGETKTETVPVLPHVHTPGSEWKSDASGHWHVCTECGERVGEIEAHIPGEWIIDSEPTIYASGMSHRECTVCGFVTDTHEEPEIGEVDINVPTSGEAPRVTISPDQQMLLENEVLTPEEKASLKEGTSIDIDLRVDDAEVSIEPGVKEMVDAVAAEAGFEHVRYLDISLSKTVTDVNGQSTTTSISELSRDVKIEIVVPVPLVKDGRSFYVIRVHDGVVTVLNDIDTNPETVTIATSVFSSYTLVYKDNVQNPSEPLPPVWEEPNVHVHSIPAGFYFNNRYHWKVCDICGIHLMWHEHVFVEGVCRDCGYVDPDYTSEDETEEYEDGSTEEVIEVEVPVEGAMQNECSENVSTDMSKGSENNQNFVPVQGYLKNDRRSKKDVIEEEDAE